MKLLGIDFGERRIGVAISDPQGRLAVPMTTLERKNDRSASRALTRLAREEGVEGIVLGEPVGLDGEAGEAALRVRRFGARLASESGLPVVLIDETLTSREAERRLRAAGVDPRRHPERVDAAAAQILLQEALDRRQRGDGGLPPAAATEPTDPQESP
ncbi:MAG: Holliday junction resolvase RuvX [Acidobacteriota bacterium]|nr:Holliday junction resolvase RuvX [Acidobacteriota bacterium]